MGERWVGRVALVTGASSGIGAAIARKLAGHGMKVVGCVQDNVFHQLQALADELKRQNISGLLYPVKCDVSKEADILAMFSEIKDKFGGVDVCVNNAGLSFDCPLLSGKTEHWRYMLEVNVLGVAICTREAVGQMISNGVDDGHVFHLNRLLVNFVGFLLLLHGHRVCIGSTLGFYCGTKHMITAMTEGLRQELRLQNSNIRITCISPGAVDTNFFNNMLGDEEGEKLSSELKLLRPEDIADQLVHALHCPPHCQIHDIHIRAVEQLQ
ncbi:dehydrogenase/reductase SDR family member 11-like [Anneissia japonica]|uniref:dehydrogenase/reductase SDR family member 11-like n=1 Tax=Anneissia japonica TaxID=1529436 RepID=UPI001425A649|nr:dehydrogenase/reductase SDR family member 11-like [Anneissia japonica]